MNTVQIPSNISTTLEQKYERILSEKLPAAWLWMERHGVRNVLDGGGNYQRGRRA